MTIQFTAKALIVNGEPMKADHKREAIAEHIKLMLFGSS